MSKLSSFVRNNKKALGALVAPISLLIPHESSKAKRDANKATAAQINLYQTQRDTIKAENTKLEAERVTRKKALARKQVRSLRSAFRAPGFMGSDGSDYTSSLGE